MTLAQVPIWSAQRHQEAMVPEMLQGLVAGSGRPAARAPATRELPMAKEEVKIGGFCGGTCVNECTKTFGEALWQACRTCPN